jgi:hypothetical protein
MQLYFIAAVSQDDVTENLDLFVWGKSLTEALIYWRNYYDADSSVVPDNVFVVPHQLEGRRSGALRWGTDVVSAMPKAAEP